MRLYREDYISHPHFEDGDVFEEKINEVLLEDDVDKFHEYLKVYDGGYYYPGFLDKCLDREAYNCALHLIEGKLPHGPPYLGDDNRPGFGPEYPVLYRVIHGICTPYVLELLLYDCQAVNLVSQPFRGQLPIHWMLNRAVYVLIHPYHSSKSCCCPFIATHPVPHHVAGNDPLSPFGLRGQPVSSLIASLFDPKYQEFFDCVLILAQHTDPLVQVALGYILNGEITRLAALLLAAPFTSGDFQTLKPYTSIASRAIHGQSVTPATYSAAALLYMFEKYGDKLTSKFDDQECHIEFSLEPQKGSAQRAKDDQLFVDRLITQMGNISFGRRLFSTSSQMTDRTRVNEIMCRDNADEVPELFDPDANLPSDHYQLLHSLLKENEGNDTFKLLQANLSGVNEEFLHSRDGLPALISAIRTFCNSNDDAMEHFKSHDAHQVNLTYMCLLHFLLGSLVKYDYLSKWSPGQSLVKLILLLFLQRELKPTLECAHFVAKRTNSINEVAWELIQRGELIQLAGLLLVARKKAMEPSASGDTIKEATSVEIVSQVLRVGSVTAATVGAAGLFELFEKAGDALAEYWSIYNDESDPVGVIVEAATRIQNSGIHVLSTDVDMTDIYTTSHYPEMLQSICERLGIKVDDTSALSQISVESPSPVVELVKEGYQPQLSSMHAYHTLGTSPGVPRSQGLDNLGTRAFSTSSRIVDRVSRGTTLKHSSTARPSPSPSPIVRDLAYLAMKLKRGVRLM